MTNKIIPYLWYDQEAKIAAEYYVGIFNRSKINKTTILSETLSGDVEVVSFVLDGLQFEAISAGPYFKLNPSVSLMVYCESKEEVNRIWSFLSEGGIPLMPLDTYPFSEHYGWIQDRYGLSWQIMYVEQAPEQKIKPALLFSNGVCGLAKEALEFYRKTFKNSAITYVSEYKKGEATSPAAKINYAEFRLNNLELVAMDHGECDDFTFNEAFSMMILCKDQKEIDYYWQKLSVVPEAESCGWLKDKYGFSWQVVPERYYEMMDKGTEEQIERLSAAVLEMKKIDLDILEKAYSK